MAFLLSLPALIKILLTFALILLVSRRLPLFVALLVGTLVIGLWMGLSLKGTILATWHEVTSMQTVWLTLVISLILVLSGLLSKSGQLEKIVKSFQSISPGHRFTLAAMPALIGLLPMPGGALFSAPMVQTASGQNTLEPELLVAINYWFRHVWEYWWPLYPGIILSITVFGIDSWKLIAAQMPLTAGVVIGGCIFILARIPSDEKVDGANTESAQYSFFREVAPIAVAIVVFLALQVLAIVLEHQTSVSVPSLKYISLLLGLCAAIAVLVRQNAMGLSHVLASTFRLHVAAMALIILSIMAFKGILVSSQAIESVRQELATYAIPGLLIVALLPFIAGFVTGIAIGFVGASFPLVVALIPDGASVIPYAVLAYGLGYMGMMLSPVHLCFLVTREFFCADMILAYKYLWKPVVFSLVWTTLLVAIYALILG
jgi:integral membrane protein (TIGR00529 family)